MPFPKISIFNSNSSIQAPTGKIKKNRFVKYVNFILAVALSLLYMTGKIPPTEWYSFWFTSFIIPFALVGNLVLLVVALLHKKKSSLYYVVALFIGSSYLIGTLGLKSLFHKNSPADFTFSVSNYNMGGYDMIPYHYSNMDSARTAKKQWLLNADADIKCYQEFATYPRSKTLNVIAQLDSLGTPYYFSQEAETDHSDYSRAGTIIISKFPIVGSGDVLASSNGFNRIAYADVRIKQDTIRIINVHLESMGLGNFRQRGNGLQSIASGSKIILRKLRTGAFERSRQVKQLMLFIASTPYPVICVGDFNELPYAYTYQFIRKNLKNAFEEAGSGFGFTYDGRIFAGLRIDNQFYSPTLHCTEFQTLYDIKFGDHYPLRAEYQLDR